MAWFPFPLGRRKGRAIRLHTSHQGIDAPIRRLLECRHWCHVQTGRSTHRVSAAAPLRCQKSISNPLFQCMPTGLCSQSVLESALNRFKPLAHRLLYRAKAVLLHECVNPTAGSLDNGVPCSRQQPHAADRRALMVRVCDVQVNSSRGRLWRNVSHGAASPGLRHAQWPDGRFFLSGSDQCPRRLRRDAALIPSFQHRRKTS